MKLADNLAQVVSAVGGLAGFTALLIEVIRRKRSKKRPPDGLLPSLLWLNETFTEISAEGGKRSSWFLDPDRKRQSALLAITILQIVDKKLYEDVSAARLEYDTAWAASSDNAKQHEMQLNAAVKGSAMCAQAIRRANDLLRKYGV